MNLLETFQELLNHAIIVHNLKLKVHEHVKRIACEYMNIDGVALSQHEVTDDDIDEWELFPHQRIINIKLTYPLSDEGTVDIPLQYFFDSNAFDAYKQECMDRNKANEDNALQRSIREKQKQLEQLALELGVKIVDPENN